MAELNFLLMSQQKRKVSNRRIFRLYEGAGVQHIAIATDNIIETVKKLKSEVYFFVCSSQRILQRNP